QRDERDAVVFVGQLREPDAVCARSHPRIEAPLAALMAYLTGALLGDVGLTARCLPVEPCAAHLANMPARLVGRGNHPGSMNRDGDRAPNCLDLGRHRDKGTRGGRDADNWRRLELALFCQLV